jgi:crossover junction endodeoxyribonuclease RuvC
MTSPFDAASPGRSTPTSTPATIVGVDPGLSGALFFIDPNHPLTGEAVDIPTHVLTRGGKKKREIDVVQLIHVLALRRITHAFVEQVGAMPGQGVSSVFAFGKGYGVILGVLAARSIPLSLIPPVRWKREMRVLKDKDGARARASQLLPDAADQWPRVHHHGRAEAALLALYGARQLQGSAAVPADVFILSVPPALEAPAEAR